MKHIEELGISPYPWKHEGGAWVEFGDYDPDDEYGQGEVFCVPQNDAEENNARLIAAAPDLYEYLVRTVGQLEYTLDWCTGISEAAEDNARLVVEHAKEVLARVAGEEVSHDRR